MWKIKYERETRKQKEKEKSTKERERCKRMWGGFSYSRCIYKDRYEKTRERDEKVRESVLALKHCGKEKGESIRAGGEKRERVGKRTIWDWNWKRESSSIERVLE